MRGRARCIDFWCQCKLAYCAVGLECLPHHSENNTTDLANPIQTSEQIRLAKASSGAVDEPGLMTLLPVFFGAPLLAAACGLSVAGYRRRVAREEQDERDSYLLLAAE